MNRYSFQLPFPGFRQPIYRVSRTRVRVTPEDASGGCIRWLHPYCLALCSQWLHKKPHHPSMEEATTWMHRIQNTMGFLRCESTCLKPARRGLFPLPFLWLPNKQHASYGRSAAHYRKQHSSFLHTSRSGGSPTSPSLQKRR